MKKVRLVVQEETYVAGSVAAALFMVAYYTGTTLWALALSPILVLGGLLASSWFFVHKRNQVARAFLALAEMATRLFLGSALYLVIDLVSGHAENIQDIAMLLSLALIVLHTIISSPMHLEYETDEYDFEQ